MPQRDGPPRKESRRDGSRKDAREPFRLVTLAEFANHRRTRREAPVAADRTVGVARSSLIEVADRLKGVRCVDHAGSELVEDARRALLDLARA